MAEYLTENSDLERADLIACAAATAAGLDGSGKFPTSVFFYPIEGAADFRYFEATNLADLLNFSAYTQKFMTDSPFPIAIYGNSTIQVSRMNEWEL